MSNPFSGNDASGTNSMGDPLGFIKNLWGSMNIPGMVAPPMSVDELDKKIKDLKTVESWLNVNMNMLRGTIQALEVQRATLAALQSLGETFAQHAQQATTPPVKPAEPRQQSNNADWPMPSGGQKIPEPAVDDEEDDEVAMPPEHNEPAASANPEPIKTPQAAAATDNNAPFSTPTAWWGLLQDQFKQAVSKALESEPVFPNGIVTPATPTKPGLAKTSVAEVKSKPRTAANATTKPTTKPTTKAASKTTTKGVVKAEAKLEAKPAARKTTQSATTKKATAKT